MWFTEEQRCDIYYNLVQYFVICMISFKTSIIVGCSNNDRINFREMWGTAQVKVYLCCWLFNLVLSSHITDLWGNMNQSVSFFIIATLILVVAQNSSCETTVQARGRKILTPELWSALGCMITDDDMTKCVTDHTIVATGMSVFHCNWYSSFTKLLFCQKLTV